MAVLVPGTTYFASDVHWQPASGDAPPPLGAFGRFLADLGELARCRGGVRLYVLGDLFEYWFERGGRSFEFYEPHLAALARACAAGIELVLLFGNRDFTYGRVLPERVGAQIAGDRAEVDLGGRRILLEHGDLLCTRDWRYQVYRRVIRSAPVRLAARAVSMERMTSIIGGLRRASRAEIERKPASVLTIVDDAVRRRFAEGFAAVVCGHVHRPERRPIAGPRGPGELITLGTWDDDGGWYVCAEGGELGLHHYRR